MFTPWQGIAFLFFLLMLGYAVMTWRELKKQFKQWRDDKKAAEIREELIKTMNDKD